MAKGIYQFYWDCGRSGELEGTFIATAEDVAKIQGKDIYFGEVLGKHSSVDGRIDDGDICLLTDDQDFIAKFEEILGEGWGSGHSPFDYLPDDWYEEIDQETFGEYV